MLPQSLLQAITVKDFCKQNPNHRCSQIIRATLEVATSRNFLFRWLRSTMLGVALPDSNDPEIVRNSFYALICAVRGIGEELKWSQQKIDEETDLLLAELAKINPFYKKVYDNSQTY